MTLSTAREQKVTDQYPKVISHHFRKAHPSR